MHLTREKFHVRGVIPIAPADSMEYEQHIYCSQPSLFLVALGQIVGWITGVIVVKFSASELDIRMQQKSIMWYGKIKSSLGYYMLHS